SHHRERDVPVGGGARVVVGGAVQAGPCGAAEHRVRRVGHRRRRPGCARPRRLQPRLPDTRRRAAGLPARPDRLARGGGHHQRAPRSESTRLNSSHVSISYAAFCLKKKTNLTTADRAEQNTPTTYPFPPSPSTVECSRP